MKRHGHRTITPGRHFCDEQITLLQQAKMDEQVETHDHEDAVLRKSMTPLCSGMAKSRTTSPE